MNSTGWLTSRLNSYEFPLLSKQVDRVSTNHQGVFVLSDYCFKWLDRYASDDSMSRQAALNMLYFPCGIIRGAFANLGISSIVSANLGSHPVCSFNVQIKSS